MDDNSYSSTFKRKARISSRKVARRLGSWLDNLHLSPDVIMIGLALLTGLCTGLGAVAFRYLIKAVTWLGYHWVPAHLSMIGNFYVILVPAIGGLIVGPLIYFYAREAKGHGVPEVMEAVALHGGRIRPVVALVKSIASSISIGSGGSVGREGPIVQIGSAVGSTLGQSFNLSDSRTRALVACGAAGGIAATFNAPIAGVIFALEVIVSEFSIRYFSTVVISAVTASVIGRTVFGDKPAFNIPIEYGMTSHWEYVFYPLLGIFAAIVGTAFIRMLYWSEDVFDNWKKVSEWIKPAIGGVLLGIIAIVYPLITGITWQDQPQIFNVGYGVIEQALSSDLAFSTALILLFLKMLATSLTLGSGGSGGVFAPSLFMGAMLGSGFAMIVNYLVPGVSSPPGAYALLGMAGVFAASAQAPITAILILFELTGDYQIILPLMLTVVVAALVGRSMNKGESIYTLKLTRRGIHLQSGKDLDILQGVSVGEVMSEKVETVPTEATLVELSEKFRNTHHHGIIILDDQKNLWGIVTVSDLSRAFLDGLPETSLVTEIGTARKDLLIAYVDESMGDALNRMGGRGVGRLPIVDRDNPDKLLGLIRRPEITHAYRLALSRRAEVQQRTKQMELRNIDNTQFIEITLQEGDKAIGKTLKELAPELPEDCILISVRRKNQVFMPHGDTVFQPGDSITAFIRSGNMAKLKQSLQKGELTSL